MSDRVTKRTYRLSAPRLRSENIAAFQAEQMVPYWALITQEERDKAASSGAAMPDGSYPILSCDGENSVDSAINAVGRGSADHDAIRRHIMKRAESLGCKSKIPDNWNADGSLKDEKDSMRPDAKLATPPAAPAKPAEPATKTCPTCGGSGNNPDNTECATCGGDGKVPDLPDKAEGAPETDDITGKGTDDTGDSGTDKAIADLRTALEAAQAAQKSDSDDKTDPNDEKVDATLAQISSLLDELDKEQATDEAQDPKSPVAPDASAVKAAKLALDPEATKTPVVNPVDKDGNVAPGTVCSTDGCGHLASMHGNLEGGDNSGACQAQNCECPQMAWASNVGTPSDPEGDDADGSGDGGGANNDGGDDNAPATNGAKTASRGGLKLLDTVPGGGPVGADEGSPSTGTPVTTLPAAAPPDTNPAPAVPGSAIMGPAFTIPVMVIEGQETGDGRSIALDALTWNAPPMPLMGLATSTHDPMGFDMNDPSIICGRIDSIERTPGENGTQLIVAKGFFLDNDDGAYFADLVEQMGRVGISADIAVIEAEETISGMDEMGWPLFESRLILGLIQGCTIVPFPAFEGAYIIVGDGTTIPEIPATVAEGMADKVPAVVASGGQLVHLMTKEICEPCNAGYDLVASGIEAPTRPPKAWFEDPNFTLGDERLKEIYVGRGDKRFGGAYACPLTITDEGEVYGHLAPWDVCHVGSQGTCVTAPHSAMNYAQFMREGQRVVTAEGDEIAVGVLTFDTGHAPTGRGTSASQAMAHYDNTGAAFADVRVGEDDHGIWIHGALRPGIDEVTLRRIKASSPSGDWREFAGNLELVACLAVNQPGFPIAVVAESGRPSSLVAAGAYVMEELREKVEEVFEEVGDVALRRVLVPMLETEKVRLRRLKLEMQKADAKRRFEKIRGTVTQKS